MTILSAQAIRARHSDLFGIFTPFVERTTYNNMTYGLGPAGYDVRIAETFFLEPGGFALASTVEHFDMPTDLLGMVADKSTWARRGIAVQHTVIEPGWRGHLTLEITNHSQTPQAFFKGGAIAQIILHMLDQPTDCPYPLNGKYQDQGKGPQPAR